MANQNTRKIYHTNPIDKNQLFVNEGKTIGEKYNHIILYKYYINIQVLHPVP